MLPSSSSLMYNICTFAVAVQALCGLSLDIDISS